MPTVPGYSLSQWGHHSGRSVRQLRMLLTKSRHGKWFRDIDAHLLSSYFCNAGLKPKDWYILCLGELFSINWYIQKVVSKVTLDPVKLKSTLNIISSKFYTMLPSHFELQCKKMVNTLEIWSGLPVTKKTKQI